LYVAYYFLYELKDTSKFYTIITNLLEIDPENIRFYRMVVYLLDQNFIKNDLSKSLILDIYRKIHEMRPEEPMSSRDFILALIEPSVMEKIEWTHVLDSTRLFKKLIETKWDKRFKVNQIEVTVVEELNAMLQYLRDKHLDNLMDGYLLLMLECKSILQADNPFMEPLLESVLDTDLRVSIVWDNGQANVELHLFEPNGQHCYAMNNRTSGGLMSTDCIGYGPVVYAIRKAETGTYTVKVKLFSRVGNNDPVVVSVSIWTRFGQKNATLQKRTAILYKEKQVIDIAKVTFNTFL